MKMAITTKRDTADRRSTKLWWKVSSQRRIVELTEEISELSRRITFKDRRIEEASLSRNYRVCDELSAEVSELKARRKELNASKKPRKQSTT